MEYVVALGANLESKYGPPAQTHAAALCELGREGLKLTALSRFYRTPFFPSGKGPDFVNAVAVLAAEMGPEDALATLHRIEASFGRERRGRWQARPLDLDLLAAGGEIRPDAATVRAWMDLAPEKQAVEAPAELILPHPRLQERAFVLVPMCDVAGDWVHPILGLTARQMCAALPQADREDAKAM